MYYYKRLISDRRVNNMAKAKITFEDVNENLVIGIENVISDNQTPAQKAALEYFKKIKVEIITINILIREAIIQEQKSIEGR